jgi:hypothetical protein
MNICYLYKQIYIYALEAGIAQSVLREATGWTAWVRFPVGAGDFSLLHSIKTGSEAHPASYSMATRG